MGWGWGKGGPPSSPYQYTGTLKSSLEWEEGSWLLPFAKSAKLKASHAGYLLHKALLYSLSFCECYRS